MGARQSQECRDALRLVHEGRSVKEAEKLAGVAESTIFSWLKRAKIAQTKGA